MIILIAGTFIDVSPAILLLTPVFLPLVNALGVNGVQFGVILISGLAVGLVTPAGRYVPECRFGDIQIGNRYHI